MEETSVNFSSGIPETVLPDESASSREQLFAAMALLDVDERRSALQRVAADNPTYMDAWARLSESGRDDIEKYAYARVGYHRGLDALRRSGWKGSGYVRWRSESNRGFLRALDHLERAAAAIGESTESERCALFLRQLDPDWAKVELD